MKKILYVSFFVLLFSFCILSIKAINKNEFPLLGKVIYLDPGHGGIDSGTTYKDIYEKNINLEVSLNLQKKLENMGAIVYLTRDGDYDLAVPGSSFHKKSDLLKRSQIINDSKCDIFLSIHLNSDLNSKWNGPQVFFSDNNKDNKNIAELFQKNLNKSLNGKRESKKDNTLFLLKNINRKGVLIELGFLSNNKDRSLLTDSIYQNNIALTISKTLKQYFK